MKNNSGKITLILIALSLCLNQLDGKETADSVKKFRNTIRINITNPLLFGDNYNVIGYERTIGKHQSFSINTGRFSLPKFMNINTDSIQLTKGFSDKGFTLAFDYRFYLANENKYNSPRGIYIGPYYSFNMFQRSNSWNMNTFDINGEINTKIRLNANLVGAQIGYQFIIKNRISIDMILFGPGIWFYSVKTTINTSLSAEDESMVFEKINEILSEKLPGRDILIQPGNRINSGSISTSSGGFRYMIQIGFRF